MELSEWHNDDYPAFKIAESCQPAMRLCLYFPDSLQQYSIRLSAVGTGVGMVIHGLTLTDPNAEIRKQALSFIKDMKS